VVFGLLIVNVKLVEPFNGTESAPKAFEIDGGATTVRLSEAMLPVPPSDEVTAPDVLFLSPAVVPVTFTASVHDALAAVVPLDRLMVPVPATAVAVPPHVFARPLGLAISSPEGRLSENPTPDKEDVELGLAIVKVSDVVPFNGIESAPNAFEIDGGAGVFTVRLADAVFPVPPSVEVTAPDALFLTPAVVPLTSKANVHDPLAASVPPDRLMVPDPAVAEIVPEPHEPLSPFGFATSSPDGRLSLKPTPDSAVPEFGLVIVKLSDVDPPTGIEAAPNAFEIDGGPTTVILAEAPEPKLPSFDTTNPVELFLIPAVVPVTSTAKVHDAPAASVAPDRLIVPEPAVAVIVPPPHDPLSPFGVATTNPDGRLSLNPTPDNEFVEFGFVIMKLSDVVPPTGIDAAPNDFEIDGGPTTVVDTDAELLVGSGSAVVEFTVAVFVSTVSRGLDWSMNSSSPKVAPGVDASEAMVQVMVPPLSVGSGVVHVHPAGDAKLVRYVFAGRTSVRTTSAASLGPVFTTLTR
jgi:hypothetical protein